MQLSNITLVSIDCLNPLLACKALRYSCRELEFHDVMLFTSQDISSNDLTVKKIAPITSLAEYSAFCIEKLWDPV